MSVFAPSVVNLWKTIESYGIDPAPLFAAEDINVQPPIDPCIRLPYQKIDRLRAKAAELSGDEAFGLRSASVYLPSQLGALGYAWDASLTLRKVALITRMCRLISGEKFRLQAVSFRHVEPKDIKPYFEYFACQLNFDQADNQLLIPLSLVDETLPGGSPEMTLLHDQVITKRLARMHREDIVARLKAVLIDLLPTGDTSDETAANALHMSVRTMHRKLADVDNNFRTILVEMRRELAEQYIMDNSLTLTEISLLLGFSEPSSFSRAFKNWTGAAPSELRQSRR
jgi:AraC-like DNA-binding protein